MSSDPRSCIPEAKCAVWFTSYWLPGADRLSHRGPKVNSRAKDDNTISLIVLCIMIICLVLKLIALGSIDPTPRAKK